MILKKLRDVEKWVLQKDRAQANRIRQTWDYILELGKRYGRAEMGNYDEAESRK